MGNFAPFVTKYPPCKICGNTEVVKNQVDIDMFGKMKGEWVCGKGHRNEIRENRRGDKRHHVSEEKTS
ncbi:MAG: hypothetical protein ACREBU_04825 [Nitrososphaera sp.]